MRSLISKYKQKRWVRWVFYFLCLFILFLIFVPLPRFQNRYSTVVYSRDSLLLNARVAADEQWRFPEWEGALPEKYETALLYYEDRYFYWHPGINPVSIFKAAVQDIKAGRIVSGGSTITMQLARLSRQNPPRTFAGKALECLMALKAEVVYRKKTILRKYASHAPFGGNVVGLQAACWRFFGVEPSQLTWAQAATLAVLPNQPALIFPGKNQELLVAKRNWLLKTLRDHDVIDNTTYDLAIEEPVPGAPKSLPQAAKQMAVRFINAGLKGQSIYSTVSTGYQSQAEDIINRHYPFLKSNHIYNAALLIMDVKTGEVLAYVGNTQDTVKGNGHAVDMITANRSYGSLLKPILYMSAMDAGEITPTSFLPDYPMAFGNFHPKNYNLDYSGLVPANLALIKSLNIPMVALLQKHGTANFLNTLRNIGFTSFKQKASYYGLTLILGGGESTLWQLTSAYAALAHKLRYGENVFYPLLQLPNHRKRKPQMTASFQAENFNPASIWTAFEAMTQLYRPGDNGHWEQFNSAQKIAWKTGTSFGGRDAWAIGVTPRYAVGVWVGNADGEGRPDLVGVKYAAPILFEAFDFLPTGKWFDRPSKYWKKLRVCSVSGMRAGKYCLTTREETVPAAAVGSDVCRYHQQIQLDSSRQFRVNSFCVEPGDMVKEARLVLSPVEALYYQKKHTNYSPLPPLRSDCRLKSSGGGQMINLIYPANKAKIYLPRGKGGERESVVIRVAHNDAKAKIYWHMDGYYLGMTTGKHNMSIQAKEGVHHFSLVDQDGNSLNFELTFLQKD